MRGTPALPELQRRFAEALLDPAAAGPLRAWIEARGLDPGRRLQIYRNNVRVNLTIALGDVYPAVRALVGEAFFDSLARRYMASHPSRHGDLHRFGLQLPAFVGDDAACSTLPWLSDIAALEWRYHEVFHEAEAEPLGAAALAGIAPERYADLRLRYHPASRCLTSRFPLLDIWRMATAADPETAGTVNLDAGPCHILIARRNMGMVFQNVPSRDWPCLIALLGGATLGEAYESALAERPGFDLVSFLAGQFGAGNIVGFEIAGSDPSSA